MTTRPSALAIAIIAIFGFWGSQAAAEDPSFDDTWKTSFDVVTLKQDGDAVTGRLQLNNGRAGIWRPDPEAMNSDDLKQMADIAETQTPSIKGSPTSSTHRRFIAM